MATTITCFLIDDDPEDHDIFRFALEEVDLPVRLITATKCVDALTTLADAAFPVPDFIFLDLNMMPMSGKECLVKIREMPRYRSTPIIIYSTSKADHHREESLRLGATHFYSKPTDISELARSLAAFFQGDF